MLKVLVVDDSALMRTQLRLILLRAGEIEVVTARNGLDALERIESFDPAVVTLDINMPEMDGLTCLGHIMRDSPRPVIVVSSVTGEGTAAAIRAMVLGAVELITKPDGQAGHGMERLRMEVVEKVLAASQARPRRPLALRAAIRADRLAGEQARATAARGARARRDPGVTLIGVSTGGPRTLDEILPELPSDYANAVVIAQHMPASFTGAFARRLDDSCAIAVIEVDRVMPLHAGHIYIGRGAADVVIERRLGRLVVASVPAEDSPWHPSVDRLVRSAMAVMPATALIGVQLTGMGDDGAAAMAELRSGGGRTIAESEATAAVFGMPGELIRRDGATRVLNCELIADQLRAWTGRGDG